MPKRKKKVYDPWVRMYDDVRFERLANGQLAINDQLLSSRSARRLTQNLSGDYDD